MDCCMKYFAIGEEYSHVNHIRTMIYWTHTVVSRGSVWPIECAYVLRMRGLRRGGEWTKKSFYFWEKQKPAHTKMKNSKANAMRKGKRSICRQWKWNDCPRIHKRAARWVWLCGGKWMDGRDEASRACKWNEGYRRSLSWALCVRKWWECSWLTAIPYKHQRSNRMCGRECVLYNFHFTFHIHAGLVDDNKNKKQNVKTFPHTSGQRDRKQARNEKNPWMCSLPWE